jgi:sortase A
MKIRIRRSLDPPIRATPYLRVIRYLCFGIGVCLLGYCGFVVLDASLYESYQNRNFQQARKSLAPLKEGVENIHPTPLPADLIKSNPVRNESSGAAGRGDSALGRIEIPSINLAAMIMEGTDAKTLRRAVGHISGTPLPGQEGNVAIAGHRDTFFRALRHIRDDDEITLTTLAGSYRYRVDSIKVVEPDDTAVLNNSESEILTLVTCYPFYFVGPAPKRFVVRAQMVSAARLDPVLRPDKH